MKKYTKNNRLLSSLIAIFIGLTSTNLNAELYFSPELISDDPNIVANISRLCQTGKQLSGNYLVDIYVNEKWFISKKISFIDINLFSLNENNNSIIRDTTGLIPCLNQNLLEKFGIDINSFLDSKKLVDESCIIISKYIPDAFTSFDFQRMRLDISIPQFAMHNRVQGSIATEQWDEGINAILLKYVLNGKSSKGDSGGSQAYYLNLNSGINLGPWRLRDNRIRSSYSSQHHTERQWQILKRYIGRNIIALRSALIIGDSNTDGSIFDSIAFRGVQLSSDDNMYPDSLRGFSPVIRGTANSNAQVSVRQNGLIIYQTFVAPGAFAINDLFPVSSSGNFEVLITEADGSTQSFIVPYSTVPMLQREGRFKYALTVGRYHSVSDRYYNPEFMQGNLVWGLDNNITLYGGAQFSANYSAGAIGGGLNLGSLGAFSADITVANSRIVDGSHRRGQSLRFLYANSLNSLGTTLQLTGYRYLTKGFHTLEETALKDMQGYHNTESVDENGNPTNRLILNSYNLYQTKKSKYQVTISQQLKELGSVYLSFVRQTYWEAKGQSDSLQIGFNGVINQANYSVSYSYSKENDNSDNRRNAEQSIYLSV